MDQLDTLIKLIESKNNISLPKEKVQLIFQYLTFCKRDKNEILSRVGDIDNHFYIIMDGIIRFYYIDMNGNEITRFFAESGCIHSEKENTKILIIIFICSIFRFFLNLFKS